jgi:hypothetical protein
MVNKPIMMNIETNQKNHSQKADGCAASKKIIHLLWNWKVHYHVQKSPPLDPILRKANLVHILIILFL